MLHFLKNDKWPAESVALVTVEIGVPCGSSSNSARKELCNEARSVVQRCLLPDLDVLLPKMSADAEGERFFIAAFADEKGAAVVANRIREQFERLPDLKERGVVLSVSFSMLRPFPSDVGATMENIVTSMATSLEESVKHQNSSEPIHHE